MWGRGKVSEESESAEAWAAHGCPPTPFSLVREQKLEDVDLFEFSGKGLQPGTFSILKPIPELRLQPTVYLL